MKKKQKEIGVNMEFCAIICEFNPLHNGHAYLIKKAKELTNLPVICLMTGNFTQRGELAILDKQIRAKHAILSGADVVLELPTIYSIGSAEIFASGAVRILNNLSHVKYLVFGSECGDIEKLQNVSKFLLNNAKLIDKHLKIALKTGKSYPAAIMQSIKNIDKKPEDILEILDKPNNKLGVEYLKALYQYNSEIIPITIPRIGEEYNSDTISEYSSASAIRSMIKIGNIKKIKNTVPNYVYNDIINTNKTTALDNALLYNIRSAKLEDLHNTFDVNEGIEYKMLKTKQTDLPAFIEELKSKRYTHNRIRHIILNHNFGITKDLMKNCKISQPYCKILQIVDKNMLKYLKNGNCNIIFSNRDIKLLNAIQNDIFSIDQRADLIYNIFVQQKRDVN